MITFILRFLQLSKGRLPNKSSNETEDEQKLVPDYVNLMMDTYTGLIAFITVYITCLH